MIIDFKNEYKKNVKKEKKPKQELVVKKKFDGMFVFYLLNNGCVIGLLCIPDTN